MWIYDCDENCGQHYLINTSSAEEISTDYGTNGYVVKVYKNGGRVFELPSTKGLKHKESVVDIINTIYTALERRESHHCDGDSLTVYGDGIVNIYKHTNSFSFWLNEDDHYIKLKYSKAAQKEVDNYIQTRHEDWRNDTFFQSDYFDEDHK